MGEVVALLMPVSAHRGVGNRSDVVGNQELDELCLSVLGIDLNLVNNGFDSCVSQKIPNQLDVKVRDSN